MNQDLVTQLHALSLFYAQNIGSISNALWLEQSALDLSNQDVVSIITSLARVKETIDNNIADIKEKLAGSPGDPEA